MNAVTKCNKCYDEAMGCNTGEIDQGGYLDCLCGAADARVAMEKELGLTEAPQWARDKAWRAYSMGMAAAEACTVLTDEQIRTMARVYSYRAWGIEQVVEYTRAILAASAAPKVKP